MIKIALDNGSGMAALREAREIEVAGDRRRWRGMDVGGRCV